MSEATILIVENEGSVSNLLKEMFEKFEPHRRARIVERISDAQMFLRTSPTQYKLITIDLDLEDSKSLQGLKALSDEFPLIPKVIITATMSHELQLEAEYEGAILYITKPFRDARVTYLIINRALNIWWVQYGLCRKAWESEQHVKLDKQMREEAPVESPLLKRWQFRAGVVAAVLGAVTTAWAFGKGIWQTVLEFLQAIFRK